MLCSLCKRHNTKSKYKRSTTWSETPCIPFRKDSVRHHTKSELHQGVVALEKCRLAAKRDGGIPQALELELSLQKKTVKGAGTIPPEKKNVKGAMQCLYWIVLSEVPHTTKYSSLVDAVQFMGCDYFKHLHQGDNAKYKSQRLLQASSSR